MSIIRANHDAATPYVAVSRDVAQDARLSFEARGLLLYLLSKPTDWRITIADLQRAGQCGRDRVYRILRELREAGYLQHARGRSTRGTIVWSDYVVCEAGRMEPYPENTDVAEPYTENPYTVQPYTEKPYTENTDMVEEPNKGASSPSQPYPEKPYTAQPYTENTDMVTAPEASLSQPYPENPDMAEPYPEKPYTENTDAYKIKSIQNKDPASANALAGCAVSTVTDVTVMQAQPASAAPPAEPPAKAPPKATPRQALFSALCTAFGYSTSTLTRELRGVLNRTTKSLHEAGAKPDDIPALYAWCAARFTDFSPAALAKWWPEFIKQRPLLETLDEPAEPVVVFVDTSELEIDRLLARAERKRHELLQAEGRGQP